MVENYPPYFTKTATFRRITSGYLQILFNLYDPDKREVKHKYLISQRQVMRYDTDNKW
jgi:hypothetical protein